MITLSLKKTDLTFLIKTLSYYYEIPNNRIMIMNISPYDSYLSASVCISMTKSAIQSTAQSVENLLSPMQQVEMRPGIGQNVDTYA